MYFCPEVWGGHITHPCRPSPVAVVWGNGTVLKYVPRTRHKCNNNNDMSLRAHLAPCMLLVPQVSNWNWARTPFKAGDRILLSGNFTTGMYIALSKSYGTASNPIIISSLDPTRRATISPSDGSNGISIYDSITEPALGLGIRITDLNIIGHDILDSRGEQLPCNQSMLVTLCQLETGCAINVIEISRAGS